MKKKMNDIEKIIKTMIGELIPIMDSETDFARDFEFKDFCQRWLNIKEVDDVHKNS